MKLHVSDHALLRYVERFCGVDVEAIRKMIEAAAYPAAKAGATAIKVNAMGFQLRRNGPDNVTVATVIERGMDRFNHHEWNAKKNRRKERSK